MTLRITTISALILTALLLLPLTTTTTLTATHTQLSGATGALQQQQQLQAANMTNATTTAYAQQQQQATSPPGAPDEGMLRLALFGLVAQAKFTKMELYENGTVTMFLEHQGGNVSQPFNAYRYNLKHINP